MSVRLDIRAPNQLTRRMLFMTIERFPRGVEAVWQRVAEKGRMIPPGVVYQGSWLEPDGGRCFQLMEAPDRGALDGWLERWNDLVDFDVVEVLTSHDFWSQQQ